MISGIGSGLWLYFIGWGMSGEVSGSSEVGEAVGVVVGSVGVAAGGGGVEGVDGGE